MLVGRAASAEVPAADPAAVAAIRGDLKGAMLLADAQLKKNPSNLPALLTRACVLLEQGDLAGARAAGAKLSAASPMSTEAKLLKALIEERAAKPTGPWVTAVVAAFKHAGLKKGDVPSFAGEVHSFRKLTGDEMQKDTTMQRFLIADAQSGPTKSEDVSRAALLLTKKKDLSLPLELIVLDVVTRAQVPDALQTNATAQAVKLLKDLAGRHPGEMYLQLAAAVSGTAKDAPFTEAEVRALERIVKSGSPHPAMVDIYETYKAALETLDAAGAREGAFSATMGPYVVIPNSILAGRVTATAASAPVELKRRVGLVCATLGRAFREGHSLLDLSFARMYLGLGAKVSGDPALQAEADAAQKDLEALVTVANDFRLLGTLSIPSLRRELTDAQARDELSLLRQLSP